MVLPINCYKSILVNTDPAFLMIDQKHMQFTNKSNCRVVPSNRNFNPKRGCIQFIMLNPLFSVGQAWPYVTVFLFSLVYLSTAKQIVNRQTELLPQRHLFIFLGYQ